MSCYKFQNIEKWGYKNHQISWYLVPSHVLEGQDLDFLVKKPFRDQKKKKTWKKRTNFGSYKRSWKFHFFILVPGVRKTDFYDFSGFFLRKNGPEIWESRVKRPGNLEWNDLGIPIYQIDIITIFYQYQIEIISISYRYRSYQDTQGQPWVGLCGFKKEVNGQNSNCWGKPGLKQALGGQNEF